MHAQVCACEQAFRSVRAYYEENHPGYNAMDAQEKALVNASADALLQEVVARRPAEECILYLQRYGQLLRDNHSYIDAVLPAQQDVDENDPEALASFRQSEVFRSTERMQLDTAALLPRLRTLPVDSIEGLWSDRNGTYVLAVVRRGAPHHDLAGVVVSSTSRCWEPGQVKLTLRPVGHGRYECRMLTRTYGAVYSIITVHSGRMVPFGWRKQVNSREAATDARAFRFQRLDPGAVVLRLPSFNGALQAQLDSFYRAHDAEIRAAKDLIIDVRGNGGGSEACWIGLLPYFYTAPIDLDRTELLVAAGNIERYRERLAVMRADSANFGEQAIASMREMIRRMEVAPQGSFIPQFAQAPAPIVLDTVLARPERVWILQDRQCASATESLLYYAGKSRKVTTVGSRSGGLWALAMCCRPRCAAIRSAAPPHATTIWRSTSSWGSRRYCRSLRMRMRLSGCWI
ncbi:MAG: hypothetical protein IPM49_09845 [Flavobacteriales bacterium]|nr:hypothetical protein [Flavobacteriales bacterium]